MEGDVESRHIREQVPIQQVSSEVLKFILDRRTIAETLKHQLKGETRVEVTGDDGEVKIEWRKTDEEMVNDLGARYLGSLLNHSLNQNMIASFITDDETKIFTEEFGHIVVDTIIERGNEFEVNAANRSTVVKIVEDTYFMAMTASRNGTLLKAIKPTVERKEVYTPQKDDKPGFNWPLFGGGGNP